MVNMTNDKQINIGNIQTKFSGDARTENRKAITLANERELILMEKLKEKDTNKQRKLNREAILLANEREERIMANIHVTNMVHLCTKLTQISIGSEIPQDLEQQITREDGPVKTFLTRTTKQYVTELNKLDMNDYTISIGNQICGKTYEEADKTCKTVVEDIQKDLNNDATLKDKTGNLLTDINNKLEKIRLRKGGAKKQRRPTKRHTNDVIFF